MLDKLIELILNESQWMPLAMLSSFVAAGALAFRQSRGGLARIRGALGSARAHGALGSARPARILAVMNLFYGCMIGVMGFGHLLAVTIKIARGTLEGLPWLLVPLGFGLLIPATWLAWRAIHHDQTTDRKTVILNVCLAVYLLALGPQNIPLAIPAALNLVYRFHSRRAVGWTVATVTAAGYLALFVGSMMFFASGKSFEEFQGQQYSEASPPPDQP